MRGLRSLLALGLLASAPSPHDGPPFPIVVDRTLAHDRLSIWADPDVGVGTFYFYLDPLAEGSPQPSEGTGIAIAVRPVDGHAPEALFEATPAEASQPYQHIGEVEFDARGPWLVRFVATGPAATEEFELEIDVTPPGAGRIDLLWFLSPFLAVAFLWVKVVLKKRELARCAS